MVNAPARNVWPIRSTAHRMIFEVRNIDKPSSLSVLFLSIPRKELGQTSDVRTHCQARSQQGPEWLQEAFRFALNGRRKEDSRRLSHRHATSHVRPPDLYLESVRKDERLRGNTDGKHRNGWVGFRPWAKPLSMNMEMHVG